MLVAVNRTALPALFLPLTKSQARIEHDRDDALVTEHIAQAIDDVERLTNATIFERTIAATSWEVAGAPLWAWAVPGSPNWISLTFNNVITFGAVDADGADVGALYLLRQADPGGVGTAWLQGPTAQPAQPVSFVIVAGARSLDDIAPALRRLVMRRAAALYEYREAALPLSTEDLVSEPSLWRPDL